MWSPWPKLLLNRTLIEACLPVCCCVCVVLFLCKQAALLGLREKAVREKARAELALLKQQMRYLSCLLIFGIGSSTWRDIFVAHKSCVLCLGKDSSMACSKQCEGY